MKNFDNHTLAAAQRAVKASGMTPGDLAALEERIGPDAVIERFALRGSATRADGSRMTVLEARARFDEIKRDRGWFERFQSGDSEAIAEKRMIDAVMALDVEENKE